jgi:hypothetical protein
MVDKSIEEIDNIQIDRRLVVKIQIGFSWIKTSSSSNVGGIWILLPQV